MVFVQSIKNYVHEKLQIGAQKAYEGLWYTRKAFSFVMTRGLIKIHNLESNWFALSTQYFSLLLYTSINFVALFSFICSLHSIATRGVTRAFSGNEMSFYRNYSAMLNNLGNRISYDCSQILKGFNNCVNHFPRCPSAEIIWKSIESASILMQQYCATWDSFYCVGLEKTFCLPLTVDSDLTYMGMRSSSSPADSVLEKLAERGSESRQPGKQDKGVRVRPFGNFWLSEKTF